MRYCENYSAVVTALDSEKSRRLFLRTRCKQWDCEYCARKNKREWRYRIMATIEKLTEQSWYFWTLTLSPKYHKTPDVIKSLKAWRKSWNKLMGKLRYYLGKFMYIRVFEQHKSGVVHVHMLANVAFDDVIKVDEIRPDQSKNTRYHSRKLASIMMSYGLGKIHDIRPIETPNETDNGVARNVSAYVTKYLTKDIQTGVRLMLKDAGMSNVRMIQTSRGWEKIERVTEHDWEVGRITELQAFKEWRSGIEYYDLNLEMTVNHEDFHEDGDFVVYPPPN